MLQQNKSEKITFPSKSANKNISWDCDDVHLRDLPLHAQTAVPLRYITMRSHAYQRSSSALCTHTVTYSTRSSKKQITPIQRKRSDFLVGERASYLCCISNFVYCCTVPCKGHERETLRKFMLYLLNCEIEVLRSVFQTFSGVLTWFRSF